MGNRYEIDWDLYAKTAAQAAAATVSSPFSRQARAIPAATPQRAERGEAVAARYPTCPVSL